MIHEIQRHCVTQFKKMGVLSIHVYGFFSYVAAYMALWHMTLGAKNVHVHTLAYHVVTVMCSLEHVLNIVYYGWVWNKGSVEEENMLSMVGIWLSILYAFTQQRERLDFAKTCIMVCVFGYVWLELASPSPLFPEVNTRISIFFLIGWFHHLGELYAYLFGSPLARVKRASWVQYAYDRVRETWVTYVWSDLVTYVLFFSIMDYMYHRKESVDPKFMGMILVLLGVLPLLIPRIRQVTVAPAVPMGAPLYPVLVKWRLETSWTPMLEDGAPPPPLQTVPETSESEEEEEEVMYVKDAADVLDPLPTFSAPFFMSVASVPSAPVVSEEPLLPPPPFVLEQEDEKKEKKAKKKKKRVPEPKDTEYTI